MNSRIRSGIYRSATLHARFLHGMPNPQVRRVDDSFMVGHDWKGGVWTEGDWRTGLDQTPVVAVALGQGRRAGAGRAIGACEGRGGGFLGGLEGRVGSGSGPWRGVGWSSGGTDATRAMRLGDGGSMETGSFASFDAQNFVSSESPWEPGYDFEDIQTCDWVVAGPSTAISILPARPIPTGPRRQEGSAVVLGTLCRSH